MIAIVLAGGKQTVLSEAHPNVPNALVPVAGEPIVAWITYWLIQQGFKHIIYSAGFGSEQLSAWATHLTSQDNSLLLDVVTESRPLGTAGAAANCLRRHPSSSVLVVNADALLLTDLRPATEYFKIHKNLDAMILSTSISNAGRFGSLEFDENNRLLGFHEKQSGTGPVNAGIYFFRGTLLDNIPSDKVFSLEYHCFPKWLEEGKQIHVEHTDAPFIDMGTPEALKKAEQKILKNRDRIIGEEVEKELERL